MLFRDVTAMLVKPTMGNSKCKTEQRNSPLYE